MLSRRKSFVEVIFRRNSDPGPLISAAIECKEENFVIGKVIGKGASAFVHQAKYKPTQTTVAIKIIRLDSSELEHIRKEIRIWKMCKHPHLLPVYGSYVSRSELHIVSPHMECGSVTSVMQRYSPNGLEETFIACILKQTLLGLDYLHMNGLIHRDIKGNNILINRRGDVQIADFGVSSSLHESEKNYTKEFVGTPCWMAPEVLENYGYDYKADIWSFGITAIELATGMAPYGDLPPLQVLTAIMTKAPPQLSDSFSSAFRQMTRACLLKCQQSRASAADLLSTPFIRNAKAPSCLIPLLSNIPALTLTDVGEIFSPIGEDTFEWDF